MILRNEFDIIKFNKLAEINIWLRTNKWRKQVSTTSQKRDFGIYYLHIRNIIKVFRILVCQAIFLNTLM